MEFSKILLIDDDGISNFINSKLLAMFINKALIFQVTSVDEASILLRQSAADDRYLVFLDLNMPDKSGWDFLNLHQDNSNISSVIVLTSSIDPSDEEKSKTYSVVKNFISKPLDESLVRKVLDIK